MLAELVHPIWPGKHYIAQLDPPPKGRLWAAWPGRPRTAPRRGARSHGAAQSSCVPESHTANANPHGAALSCAARPPAPPARLRISPPREAASTGRPFPVGWLAGITSARAQCPGGTSRARSGRAAALTRRHQHRHGAACRAQLPFSTSAQRRDAGRGAVVPTPTTHMLKTQAHEARAPRVAASAIFVRICHRVPMRRHRHSTSHAPHSSTQLYTAHPAARHAAHESKGQGRRPRPFGSSLELPPFFTLHLTRAKQRQAHHRHKEIRHTPTSRQQYYSTHLAVYTVSLTVAECSEYSYSVQGGERANSGRAADKSQTCMPFTGHWLRPPSSAHSP